MQKQSFRLIFFVMGLAVIGHSQVQGDGFSTGERYERWGKFGGAQPVLTADGKTIYFAAPSESDPGDLFAADVATGKVRRVISEDRYQGQPFVSRDMKQIVYISEVAGRPAVWISDADGKNARRLTHSPYAEEGPIFSPGGQQIAFMRRVTDNPSDDNHEELFVIDIDGTHETRLVEGGFKICTVCFSAEGDSVVFRSDQPCDPQASEKFKGSLRSVKLSGGVTTCLTPLREFLGGCSLSIDGKTLVYIDDNDKRDDQFDLFSENLGRNDRRRLTNLKTWMNAPEFGFNPDRFTFLAGEGRDGAGDIYLFDMSTGVARKIQVSINGSP